MSNILYVTSKYLKWTFDKKSIEIALIKYDPGMKNSLNKVQ